ncbi:MAG: hypothetical protein ACTSQ7_02465 [Alphaproteobacteria bacterium]
MRKGLRNLLGAAALTATALTMSGESHAGKPDPTPPPGAPRGMGPVVYVYGDGQGLFYDTIVLGALPSAGPFQELEMGGPSSSGLQTEFGPGDEDYFGGRWWIDQNPNGVMDAGDVYFLCPLLGPGRDYE